MKEIKRSKTKIFLGLLGGIAEGYGWNSFWIRSIFLILFFGVMAIFGPFYNLIIAFIYVVLAVLLGAQEEAEDEYAESDEG